MIQIKPKNPQEAYEFLITAASLIQDVPFRLYCLSAIDKMKEYKSPASTKHHHVYEGGLLIHTYEVVSYVLALSACQSLDFDEFENLLVAAILHDHMKIKDYQVASNGLSWEKTWHGNHIYHITEGYTQFKIAMVKHPNPSRVQEIGHCLVSHHGRSEWGSYIEPKTQIAEMLHLADGFSVKYGPGK